MDATAAVDVTRSPAIKIFGRATSVLTGVSVVLLLWATAYPGVQVVIALLAVMVGIVAGGCWLVLVILVIRREERSVTVVAAPVVMFLAVCLGFGGASERLALALAKPALEQALKDGSCPSFAGIVPIQTCDTAWPGTATVFIVNRDTVGLLVTGAGWAKIDDPKEQRRHRHLGDGWYSVTIK